MPITPLTRPTALSPSDDARRHRSGPGDDPVAAEIERFADRLRATKAAALADPNTPPWRRKLLEAKPPPWWETENPPPPTPARTRQRKPTLASVLRQMQVAGVEVAGVEISGGSIKVISGKPVGGFDTDAASSDPRWN